MPPLLPDMPSILPAPPGPDGTPQRPAPGHVPAPVGPTRLAASRDPAPGRLGRATPAFAGTASTTLHAPRPSLRFAASAIPRKASARAARPGALALPALAGLLALAACNSDPNRFPPACPATAILADAADLTRYDGRGQDLTDMVVDGKITGLAGRCQESGDGKTLQTTVTVSLDLSRGPGAQGRSEPVGYFVAVTRGGDTILDKRTFELRVAFPPNTDLVHVSGEPIELALPTPAGVTGATYRILIGFQLSPTELALNRRRGVR